MPPLILPNKGNLLLPVLHALVPNHAPITGRVWVIIRGSGFVKNSIVHFGKSLARPVRFVSSTELRVLAPPGKGFVTVTVHTAHGTSTVLRFHYAGVVKALIPNHAPLAGGVWVTIRGSGFTKHMTVHFGKTLAKQVRFVSATVLRVLAPPGKGFVSVTVSAGHKTVESLRFHYAAAAKAKTHKG